MRRLRLGIGLFLPLLGVIIGTHFGSKPRPFLSAGVGDLSVASIANEVPSSSTYVYFVDCEGQYTKVDFTTQSIVHRGELWDDPSATRLKPERSRGSDACLIGDVQYDYRGGWVYVLSQHEGSHDSAAKFSLLAFQLPKFNVRYKADFEGYGGLFPTTLLAGEKDLLVSYQKTKYPDTRSDDAVAVLARYRVPELELVETTTKAHKSSETTEAPYILSETAYWDMKGRRIIDEDIIRDANGYPMERVDGDKLLTDRIRKKFERLERPGPDGKKHLDVTYADSAAGKILFVVGADVQSKPIERKPIESGSGLLIYDALNGVAQNSIPTLYSVSSEDPRTVHLTPNGKLIVLEKYKWIANCDGDPADCRKKTGTLVIYDIETGRPSTLSVKTDGSMPQVIGFSYHFPELLYYRIGQNIYVINLRNVEEKREPIRNVGTPTTLFFSDR